MGGDGAVGSHRVGWSGGPARANRIPPPPPPPPAGAAAEGGQDTARISFRDLGRRRPDMKHRSTDVGFLHMLADAAECGDEIVLVGRNVFREEYEHPNVDEIIVPSAGLVEGAVGERR